MRSSWDKRRTLLDINPFSVIRKIKENTSPITKKGKNSNTTHSFIPPFAAKPAFHCNRYHLNVLMYWAVIVTQIKLKCFFKNRERSKNNWFVRIKSRHWSQQLDWYKKCILIKAYIICSKSTGIIHCNCLVHNVWWMVAIW